MVWHKKNVVVHKSVYYCINCTSLVVSTCRIQGSTILWVTPNTERGTIESCKSGCVIPGRSVSDSLGTVSVVRKLLSVRQFYGQHCFRVGTEAWRSSSAL